MIQAIRQWFQETVETQDRDSEQTLRHAAAVLMADMMRSDGSIDAREREAMRHALLGQFELDPAELDALVRQAETEAEQATDYFRYTSRINQAFSPAQKLRIIEHLWAIAHADGELDKYEEHMVRRIAELIHVPHRDFIAAKLRVQENRK